MFPILIISRRGKNLQQLTDEALVPDFKTTLKERTSGTLKTRFRNIGYNKGRSIVTGIATKHSESLKMKSLTRIIVFVLALVVWCRSQSMVAGQVVVFLPEYSQFRVNSSFFVPDGGSLYQGGVSRFSQGATNRGVPGLSNIPGAGRLFGNRSIGGSTSSFGVVTTARLHSMRDIGEGILAGTHDQYGNLIPAPRINQSFSRDIGSSNSVGQSNAVPTNSSFEGAGQGGRSSNRRVTVGQSSADDLQRRAQFLKKNLGRNN